MPATPSFAIRPLNPEDLEQALGLVRDVGVHGVYVGNFLADRPPGEGGEVVVLAGAAGVLGLLYFGARGNLIVMEGEPLDPVRVARAVHLSAWDWRIVLGPDAVVEELARMEGRPPLVHRRQVYYGVAPDRVAAGVLRTDVRLAERRDQARLLAAALDLNKVDLHVDPRQVHRPWLKDSIRRRIRDGLTMVVGPAGALTCKLDIGSRGAFGTVVEGVYTFAECRGRGLASGLVATVARGCEPPLVCLHVAEGNATARRAYERAGMQRAGECVLMLRG